MILTALALMPASHLLAQDDDMYFVPKKDTPTPTRPNNDGVVVSIVTEQDGHDDEEGGPLTHSGSIRDVDEYNRRVHYAQGYGNDSIPRAARQDSILVSMEDYENTMRLKRFDGYNNILLITDSPWSYDPWYYDTYYWHSRWYDPWYRPWYDPWDYSFRWHYGWGGHYGWGWGYHYAWNWPGWHGGYWPHHTVLRPRPNYTTGRYNSRREPLRGRTGSSVADRRSNFRETPQRGTYNNSSRNNNTYNQNRNTTPSRGTYNSNTNRGSSSGGGGFSRGNTSPSRGGGGFSSAGRGGGGRR